MVKALFSAFKHSQIFIGGFFFPICQFLDDSNMKFPVILENFITLVVLFVYKFDTNIHGVSNI